jgi:hypothetical protein
VRKIEAGFLDCTSRISRVSQPTDISITHTKPHLSDIQNIRVTRLRRASEGCDAPQIAFRAILSVQEVYTARIVLKLIVSNYCYTSQLCDVEALFQKVVVSLLLRDKCSSQGPAAWASEHKPPHEQSEERDHR